MKRALLLLTILLTAACSHGRTASFPAAADPASAGQVAVMRNNNLFGWWFPVKVTYDDAVIAHLRSGERVVFQTPPGLHTVGVADRGISVASTWRASGISVSSLNLRTTSLIGRPISVSMRLKRAVTAGV